MPNKYGKTAIYRPPLGLRKNGLYSGLVLLLSSDKKKSMKWDFKMVVLIVEWSLFQSGLKAGFYCNTVCTKYSGLDVLIFWHKVMGLSKN